jgi:Ca2+-binding RTX toxin-like protein
VLRLELSGAPAAGNPFIGQAGARGEIWARGFRNPWRFDFDPQTGRLWLGDVGQATLEEFDIVVSGGNYAWPRCEGTLPTGCQQPGDIDPIFTYPHSGTGALGSSITGGSFAGPGFGTYAGCYIFGDYTASKLYSAVPNAARDDITGSPSDFVTGASGPVDIVFSPGGALHYAAINAGEVRRVAPPCGGVAAMIVGTPGDDNLSGTNGSDVIVGLGGNDTLCGDDGDDRVLGGAGNDTLSGLAGNDTLIGHGGADALNGGGGIDTASYVGRAAGVTADIDGVADDGNSDDGPAGARDSVASDVERLIGGNGSDTLTGSAANNTLDGRNGADVMSGLGGIDTVTYGSGTAGVTVDIDGVSDDGNSADGPAGTRDNVAADVENVIGGTGADTLTGSAANNRLSGGLGADALMGLTGNDNLFANDGAADTQIDCDGGANDIAHVDGADPAPVGCETIGP